MREEQKEEIEVLKSIYEGDSNFVMINDSTFQYKYGESGDNRSFLLEICWPEEYPDVIPTFNLDLFYNKHILPGVKEKVQEGLAEQADASLGMSMTFTLFEWLKEAAEEILTDQPADAGLPVAELTAQVEDIRVDDSQAPEDKKLKKENLTKAQKRRMWDRQNAGGERPRGWNWVDIVKHLSQTGGGKSDG